MMQKVLAIICVVLIVAAGALIVIKGTEGYDISVQDVTAGVATTITISNAVFSQERLEGNHNVTVEVAGNVYDEVLSFVDGEATFNGINPIDEVGKYTVKVTLNDRVKMSNLNVFLYMVTDDRGKEVGFFDYPETIVSLGKAFTEIIIELDCGDNLVAVDSYSKELAEKHPVLNDVDDLGAFSSSWDSEYIAQLNPDLVILHRYTWGSYPQLIKHLEGFNIKVLAYYPNSYDQVVDLVGRFGVLLNNTDDAQGLQTFMTDVKDEVISKTSTLNEVDKPRVYAELRNLRTVNNGSLMHELIIAAGGVNVAQNASAPSTYLANVEIPIVFYPDIIVLENAHPKSSTQFRDDYQIPGSVDIHRFTNTYLNYSPSLAYGMMEMAEVLHPGIVFDFPVK